jgi:4-aminobutyrate aminotransferase
MVGVEFADRSGAADGKLRNRVMRECFERGLLLLSCGQSTLRFCPPLIVSEKEVATAVKIFDAAVAALQ